MTAGLENRTIREMSTTIQISKVPCHNNDARPGHLTEAGGWRGPSPKGSQTLARAWLGQAQCCGAHHNQGHQGTTFQRQIRLGGVVDWRIWTAWLQVSRPPASETPGPGCAWKYPMPSKVHGIHELQRISISIWSPTHATRTTDEYAQPPAKNQEYLRQGKGPFRLRF